ncbi:MAG TPA: hypothetical protein VEA60_16235 [Allosphingosinicella sp.]|nr:hypothetical protein [Allosphingosinicella sp.]
MRRILQLSLAAAALLLTGCASSITALQNSPTKPHTLRPNRFFSLTGERRLAFQVKRSDDRVAWCAESLPEASQAVSATSKPNLQVPKGPTLGTDESFSTTLLQTFARTEIAEMYRQMAWQACQAWAQEVYTDAQYRDQLNQLLASGIKVIETRATQALPGSAPVPRVEPKPDPKAEAKPK